MRRLLLVALLCAACSAGGAAETQLVVVRLAPGEARTPVAGGSEAERRLLRQIVARVEPTGVLSFRVGPAAGWSRSPSDRRVDADLRAREDLRGQWVGWVVAGAFRDLAAARGVARVIVQEGGGGGRIDPAEPPGRAASPADARALADRVEAAARAAGARSARVEVLRPHGLAVSVRFVVDDPAEFLRRRLPRFEQAAFGPSAGSLEGTYLQVRDTRGRVVLRVGGSRRLRSGLLGVDPEVESCTTHHPLSRAVSAPRPQPCPL